MKLLFEHESRYTKNHIQDSFISKARMYMKGHVYKFNKQRLGREKTENEVNNFIVDPDFEYDRSYNWAY